jgi:polyvinyl alcohol dehydrogenase (cytochrome)
MLSVSRAAVAAACVLCAIGLAAQSPGAPAANGAAVFRTACAGCHNDQDPSAPSQEALAGRSPQAILDALTAGSMRYQGLALSGPERRAVAEYLTGRTIRGTVAGATIGRCVRPSPLTDPTVGVHWNGWGPDVANTHFQPADRAGLAPGDVPRLHLKWAFAFPDATSAWGQPTVAGGRLFVGSQNGTVYSLDARTGCIAWTFEAHGSVRASVSVGLALRPRSVPAPSPVRPPPQQGRSRDGAGTEQGRSRIYVAYFSDQKGYAYAVNASTGQSIWTRRVDDHPLVRLTGSPTLFGNRLYVPTSSYEEGGKPHGYACCTFRGSIVALDAASGEIVWKAYTIPEAPTLLRAYADGSEAWGPAGGAIWSAPTVDVKRGALYVGVGNTYSGPAQPTTDAIVAFDLKTGSMRWAHQLTPNDVFGCTPGEINCLERPGPDFDFGAAPALARLPDGRDLIVAGQKSGVAYALDPDRKGAQVWRYRAGGGSGLGGIQWGVAVDGTRAYFPVAEIYAPTPGGLHAVQLQSGTREWLAMPPPPVCGKPSRACSSAQFAAVTVIPGIVFSPSNDGAVRAYSTTDGSVVWSFDSNHEFKTVNGVKAKGGSMNGAAPVVAGGMVYVNSGYGAFGLRPGNVLLAFGVDAAK